MFLFLAAGGLDALAHNLWAVRHDVCLKRGAEKVPLLVLFPCLAGCSSHFFLALWTWVGLFWEPKHVAAACQLEMLKVVDSIDVVESEFVECSLRGNCSSGTIKRAFSRLLPEADKDYE